MNIVHWMPDVPGEGAIVHARGRSKRFRDHPAQHIERCVFKNKSFVAGGDFPIPSFELHDVDAWVYQSDMFKILPGGFGAGAVAALIESESV